MEVLHRITALKLAGFTLEKIARINSGADEETVLLKNKSKLLAKLADLTRQIAVVEEYLSKGKNGLSAPVLIKTISETTVAYMRIRLESYETVLLWFSPVFRVPANQVLCLTPLLQEVSGK